MGGLCEQRGFGAELCRGTGGGGLQSSVPFSAE